MYAGESKPKVDRQTTLLSLSTAAIASRTDKAEEIVVWLEKVGVRAVELNGVKEHTYQELRSLLPRAGISVLSLHNFCPVPETSNNFLFVSDDPDERLRAVGATINTLRSAAEVGARAVVCHLDYVPLQKEVEEFAARCGVEGDTAGVKAARERLRKLRQEKAAPYLDRALLCLDPILDAAASLGIMVGLETRCGYHEIPSPEELGLILEKFAGAPLGYWHDVGHAHQLEFLGLYRQEELLKRYQEAIIGVHLHDARGGKDHLPPGTGEVDLAAVLTRIPSEAIKTVEVAESQDAAIVRKSLEYLSNLLQSARGKEPDSFRQPQINR